MAISREEIEKVAFLARIRVSDAEMQGLESDLSNILDLVDQLQAADTAEVSPMAHPLDATQRLRPDAVTDQPDRKAFQALAPAAEAGCYLVPRVIE